MANNRFKLENMLIRSYAHLRSIELKAYFKANKDLHFDGLPNEYIISSMTRMQGSRYMVDGFKNDVGRHASYCFDTMKPEILEINISDSISCFVEGQYMLVTRDSQPIAILRNLINIGQIDIYIKLEHCKNWQPISGRYAQQAGHSVYALDKYARLYRIEWQDIKDGKYCKTLVKENVENFYVDARLGLATVNMNGILSATCGTQVDLKAKVDSDATWTMVTCISKCWLVCGDRDGHTIMAGIEKKGYTTSTLKLKLTSNGYKNRKGIAEFAGIYSLQNVFTKGRRGIMLAIERDGCCHLISVMYGRLSKLQSIASIVNVDVVEDEKNHIVSYVTATGSKSEFIAGGIGWTKRIILKLK